MRTCGAPDIHRAPVDYFVRVITLCDFSTFELSLMTPLHIFVGFRLHALLSLVCYVFLTFSSFNFFFSFIVTVCKSYCIKRLLDLT